MTRLLFHRGPDDGAVQSWLGQAGTCAVLGHRRLSIQDPSPLGRQPMRSARAPVSIVLNGEIYNFKELRAPLLEAGVPFTSGTDTEVVLELFVREGPACLGRLRGMFAIAVFDERTGELWLARDAVGIKPLHWRRDGNGIAFASELRSLLRRGDAVAPESLRRYLMHGFLHGEHAMVAGIERLLPGHVLRWHAGTVTVSSFVEEAPAPELDPDWSEDRLTDALERCLLDAVAAHMVSDVPVGAFLSGGIDSGVVVSLMTRLARQPVHTFALACPEDPDDEAGLARLRSVYLGTEHHELALRSEDLAGLVPETARLLDEPLADYSFLPTYALSRLAASRVKVVLSGDGGDELFCGYRRYLALQPVAWFERLPSLLQRPLRALLLRAPWRRARTMGRVVGESCPEERYKALFGFPGTAQAARLLGRDTVEPDTLFQELFARAGGSNLVEKSMAIDQVAYMVDDILLKVDRASMAHALEVRPPLLDRSVRAFARALPLRHKLRGTRTKWLLRKVLDRYLPRCLYERKKRGFTVPMAGWLRGSLRPVLERYLAAERLEHGGFFAASEVRRLVAEHTTGASDHSNVLWALLSFEQWRERFGIAGADALPEVVLEPAPRAVPVPHPSVVS